ncbi:MAG: hypothetical protein C0393_07255 [Anaerolinea sp.]|nr:hypothetical protein [Anaerolinea sp.]
MCLKHPLILRNTIYNPANGIKDVEQQKLASQWLDKRQQAALLGHSSLEPPASIRRRENPTWKRPLRPWKDKAYAVSAE